MDRYLKHAPDMSLPADMIPTAYARYVELIEDYMTKERHNNILPIS